MFMELKHLSFLKLSENSITYIQPYSFKGLQHLRTLWLESNKLTRLDAKTFFGLKELRKIYLSNNKLHTVNALTFRHLTSLEEILLDNNRLEVLANDTLAGLNKIKTVNLHVNRLTTLHKDVLIAALNHSRESDEPVKLSLRANPIQCNLSLCWAKIEEKQKALEWDRGMSPNCINYNQRWDVDFCGYGMNQSPFINLVLS